MSNRATADAFRKPTPSLAAPVNDDFANKRVAYVDTLSVNKEKNSYLIKLNSMMFIIHSVRQVNLIKSTEKDLFFSYQKYFLYIYVKTKLKLSFINKGNGAPLRNSNNETVARLPNINDNLWNRYAAEKEGNNNKDVDMESKKQEIHSLIDSYSQRSFRMNQNDPLLNERRNRYGNLDPRIRQHSRPEGYWNDWWGRPGD